MKQFFKAILIITIILVVNSCANNSEKKQKTIKEKDVIETPVNEQALNNDWINEIKLDKNTRWIANIETTKGVDEMLKLVNGSIPKTVDDYLSLANTINNIKNKVVKECTMKGPSHDNLHIFLHPLIEKINHLLKVTSTEEGLIIKSSIKENLTAYKNYFQ